MIEERKVLQTGLSFILRQTSQLLKGYSVIYAILLKKNSAINL